MQPLIVHAGNLYGGVERVLETVADANRFYPALSPRFALCFDGPLAGRLQEAAIAPVMLGAVRLTRPDLVWRARRRLAAEIVRRRPDLVIFPSVWTHVAFAPVVRRASLPLVLWLHDALSGVPRLERLAGRHAPDLLICNSVYSLTAARTVFPDTPAAVVYCPLRLESSSADRAGVRRTLQVDDGCTVIICVARMERYKGQWMLLEALAGMPPAPDWRCWIVGGAQRPEEAVYEAELKAAAEMGSLRGRVQFLGQRRDVAALLRAADIFCHPNQGAETFGLSIVEALHARLPVVASGLGGPEEILADGSGRLIPPDNVMALRTALSELVRDGTLRERLAAGGPARAHALCDPSARLSDLHRALQGAQPAVVVA